MAAGHVSDKCDASNKTVAFGLNQPSNIAIRAAELAIRGFIALAFQIAGAAGLLPFAPLQYSLLT